MAARPTLVDQADVEAVLLRSLTDTESSFIYTLIEHASAKLRAAMPSVDARMAALTTDPTYLDPTLVASVLAGVIKRVLVNPSLASAATDSSGPYSRSVVYGARGANPFGLGELVITMDDLRELSAKRARSGPRMIQLTPTQAMQPRPGWYTGAGAHLDPVTGEPIYNGWGNPVDDERDYPY